IVEDSAEDVGPNQMRKSEYLAEVRDAICSTVETMIAPTGRSTDDCPYLEFVFSYFARRSVEYLNQSIGQFMPETSGVSSARDTIPIITERMSRSTAVWLATGQISGLPENVPTGLMGAAMAAGSGEAAPSPGISFKAKAGGARAARDPRSIQGQLGSGAP